MTELRRELTTFDLTMIAIGSTIGSGIFLTPSSIAHALPAPIWIFGVWILGGVMALCGALTFAELGAMLPQAGGVYVFLSEAYGGLAGFLYGWAYFLVVNTGGIAALAVAFSTYLGYFFPLGPEGTTIAAITGILVVSVINILGVKAGGVFSDIFTLLKLLAIAGLIAVGLGLGSSRTTDFLAPLTKQSGIWSALATAMVGVLWSYGGWQHATFTAAEARNPARSIPRALILAAIAVTATYLLTIMAYLFLLTPASMGDSERLATDAMAVALGGGGAAAIALAIFISTFGTAGIYTLTAPRIYYAMARDGVFFRKVAALHPRFGTPIYAILIQSAWAVLLILFWGTFENLISYVVFTDWIFFGLAASSVFIFRRRSPGLSRPYRTTGYPVTPALFVLLSAWFVANTFVGKPAEACAGLAFLALGIPVYYLWRRK